MWQPGPAPPPPAVVPPEAQGALAGAAGFVCRDMSDPPCISVVPPDPARAPARVAQLWLCGSLMPSGKCQQFWTSVRQNNVVEPFALFATSCYNKTDLYQPAINGMAGHVESTVHPLPRPPSPLSTQHTPPRAAHLPVPRYGQMHQFVNHAENSDYMTAFRAVARQLGKAGGSVVAGLAMEPLQKLLTGAVYTFNVSKNYEAAHVRKSYNLTKNSNKAYEVVFKDSAGAEVSRLLVCVPYEVRRSNREMRHCTNTPLLTHIPLLCAQFGCVISCNACRAAYNREGVSEVFASALWAEVYDGKDSRPAGV